jgi:sugar phosphate permease
MTTAMSAQQRARLMKVLAVTYVGYIALNVVRKTTSVVKSSLQSDLELSSVELGAMDTAFLTSYTIGQVVLGRLGDTVGVRVILVSSLIVSAICTGLCSVATSSSTFVAVNLMHGLAQSGAWSASVKVVTECLGSSDRGSVMGVWTTCSPMGGIAGSVISTALLVSVSWRGAYFWPAPFLLAFAAVYMLTLDADAAAGKECAADSEPPPSGVSFSEIIALPGLGWICASYFLVKFLRYTLLFWLPFYLTRSLGYSVAASGYASTTFEVGGVFGAVLLGWVSDKFFAGRKLLPTMLFLLCCASSLLLYVFCVKSFPTLGSLLMVIVGGTLLGPDAVMSGMLSQDISERSGHGSKIVGSVTGIINGVGSLESIFQGVVTAWVSDRFGWEALFFVLVGAAASGAVVLLPAVLRESRGPCASLTRTRGKQILTTMAALVSFVYLLSLLTPTTAKQSQVGKFSQRSEKFLAIKHAIDCTTSKQYSPLLQSVYQLPRLIQAGTVLAADIPGVETNSADGHVTEGPKTDPDRLLALRNIYEAVITGDDLELPQEMIDRILINGKIVSTFQNQSLVTITNVYQPELTVSHNYVRSQRFGITLALGQGEREKIVTEMAARKCNPPDFCSPRKHLAGNGAWGDLEDDNAIVRANMGKLSALHGLVLSKNTFQPMLLKREEYMSMFTLTSKWFIQANRHQPSAHMPAFMYDMMSRGGASQLHPHFQTYLTPKRYLGKFEAARRAAKRYAADHPHRSYFTDLVNTHFWLGLGLLIRSSPNLSEGGSIAAYVSLTAVAGIEVVIVADHNANAAFIGGVFHEVMEASYKLNWGHVSSGCAFPAIGAEAGTGLPFVMCRIATRGSHTASTSDVSSNEMFGTAVATEDVLKFASRFRAAIEETQPTQLCQGSKDSKIM